MSGAEETGPSKLAGRLIAGTLIGLVVYAGMVLYADAGPTLAALAEIPLWVVPAACGLSFLNYVVRFPRWQRYCALLDIRLDRGTSFLIYLAGLALTVSPGKMGEVFKSWLIRRVDGTPVHKSAPIVIAERFTDLLGFLFLIAIGGITTQPEYAWLFWATLALCAVLLFFAGSRHTPGIVRAVLARLPMVHRLVPKVDGAFTSTRVLLAPRELVLPTLLATLGWGLECVGFYLIVNAQLGDAQEVSLGFCAYSFALSAVAGAVLIFFPAGLGVTEGLLGTLLRREYSALGMGIDVARAKAASAVILIRLCTLWFAVVVGLAATALFRRRHRGAAADG